MGIVKKRVFCPECERHVLGEQEQTGCAAHVVNLVLCFFTGGLWIPIFLLVLITSGLGPYKCPVCGSDTTRALNKKQQRVLEKRKAWETKHGMTVEQYMKNYGDPRKMKKPLTKDPPSRTALREVDARKPTKSFKFYWW